MRLTRGYTMHHRFRTLGKIASALLFVAQASAALLPYPSPLPSVSQSYDSILVKTWEGIKKRNIDAYTIPLVHRPKSEMPHDAVSEGVGYGMICALYCNDQTYFNKIWDAGEQYMWSTTGNCYNWRVDRDGKTQGEGGAADADEDIACALIFADMLVKKTIWQPHTGPQKATYAVRAQSIIENIWTNMVEDGKYFRAGNNFGGKGFLNPGYFAPAYYRIFKTFGTTSHDWNSVIDQCYTSIEASQGYKNGLVPDWEKADGAFTDGGVGYNSYGNGQYFYKDAIRVLWRCAIDYQWNAEPRAKKFLDNSFNFIKTADRANFFKMDGSLLTDTFTLCNNITRNRSEHSHLTIGMWATAAMASKGKAAADSFSAELMKYYTPGADFFGKASDPGNEDTLHNDLYFDQFLAWFGASFISGISTNIYEDLSDSNFSLPVDWAVLPTLSTDAFDANISPLKISGVFNKSARWTVLFKKQTADSSVQISGVGETLSVVWYGLATTGALLPAGMYDVTISARALQNPITKSCWLGRPLDLKMGNRLVVDNFFDRDLLPFIGAKWQNYLDSYEGKSGKSTVPVFEVQGQDTSVYLCWSYVLNGGSALGYDPYSALEWNCKSPADSANLTTIDTIIVVAKSKSALGVSAQLVTSDVTDFNFFQDSMYLTTEWKEFRLPITSFKHRFSGGSGSVNLGKLTGLRFQVQNKDNSANEIDLKRMLVTGSLTSRYNSPPSYVVPPISIRDGSMKRAEERSISVQSGKNGSVRFFLPATFQNSNILIIDAKGKVVRRIVAKPGITPWDGFDNGKNRVQSGMYFAVISGPGGTVNAKIPVIGR